MRIHPSILLSISLGLFAPAFAQQDEEPGQGDSNNGDTGNNDDAPSPTASRTSARTTASPTEDSETASETESQTEEESATDTPPSLETSTTSPISTTTLGADVENDLPSGLPKPPKIAGVIPNYTAAVPPTVNNPFNQKSNLPEGTFFIAVGGALAFIAFIAFAWSAFASWSLRRNVRRAAMDANYNDSKTLLGGGGAARKKRNSNFYSSAVGSSMSLDRLANKTPQSRNGSHTPNTSLFFSPTAGSGAGSLSAAGGARGSNYLPAGYYAAANTNNSQTNVRRPTTGGSPPGSPLMPPQSRGRLASPGGSPRVSAHGGNRPSSLRLDQPPQPGQRTPSGYFEDLLSNPPPPSSHGQERGSVSGQGSSGRSRHSGFNGYGNVNSGRNY